MVDALTAPDALALVRTLATAIIFLYLPGHLFFKGGLKNALGVSFEQAVCNAFFSVLLLACVGMVLAFTVGISEVTLVGSYALLGGLWWMKSRH